MVKDMIKLFMKLSPKNLLSGVCEMVTVVATGVLQLCSAVDGDVRKIGTKFDLLNPGLDQSLLRIQLSNKLQIIPLFGAFSRRKQVMLTIISANKLI